MKAPSKTGSLLIIGGSEDRTGAKEILQRFVELAGGVDQPMVLLTAASEVPDDVWKLYKKAFDELGVTDLRHIRTTSRSAADKPDNAEAVAAARGIFMTGGAQTRLHDILGESAVAAAMHKAHARGACVAGTSAGASALCARMLMNGTAELLPEKDAIRLGPGFGFIDGVIVDQHFSQRHRINRLLSVTAENPALFGIGVDEDTALVVQPGEGIEIAGRGSVNIVDCRKATTNIKQLAPGATPTMLGVCLHVLPADTAFHLAGGQSAPQELTDLITTLTNRTITT